MCVGEGAFCSRGGLESMAGMVSCGMVIWIQS
jgi:hypothetical protein